MAAVPRLLLPAGFGHSRLLKPAAMRSTRACMQPAECALAVLATRDAGRAVAAPLWVCEVPQEITVVHHGDVITLLAKRAHACT